MSITPLIISARKAGIALEVCCPNKKSFFLEASKQDYVIDQYVLFEDEADMVRIASQYGARYDGWYAEQV